MTEDEYQARGTPLEARVKAVMGREQGGVWYLGQQGYEINLDDYFTADTLRQIADAMEGRDPVAEEREACARALEALGEKVKAWAEEDGPESVAAIKYSTYCNAAAAIRERGKG